MVFSKYLHSRSACVCRAKQSSKSIFTSAVGEGNLGIALDCMLVWTISHTLSHTQTHELQVPHVPWTLATTSLPEHHASSGSSGLRWLVCCPW